MNEKRNRAYYEKLFSEYPDVVNMEGFRKMLGGIGDATARKLVKEKRVRFIFTYDFRHDRYFFPKVWVIDYVLSEHYQNYRKQLKVQV